MTKSHTALTKATTLATAVVAITVSIAAIWWLDWRWIPTVVLAGLLAMFLASFVDSALDERDKRRAEADEVEAANRAVEDRLERIMNGTATPVERLAHNLQQAAKNL